MYNKITALKGKAKKRIVKGFVKAKTTLQNCRGDKNLEEGVSLVKVFVIGALFLALLILVFKGPITEWLESTVSSWFTAGGESRPT